MYMSHHSTLGLRTNHLEITILREVIERKKIFQSYWNWKIARNNPKILNTKNSQHQKISPAEIIRPKLFFTQVLILTTSFQRTSPCNRGTPPTCSARYMALPTSQYSFWYHGPWFIAISYLLSWKTLYQRGYCANWPITKIFIMHMKPVEEAALHFFSEWKRQGCSWQDIGCCTRW